MNKNFRINCILLLMPAMFLFSCNEKEDNNAQTSTATATPATTDAAPATTTAQNVAPALVGNLYRLYVQRTAFATLPNGKKLVLAHTFRDPDILTLYGWPCKNNNCTVAFDANPAIRLIRGTATGQSYGPNVIFANVFIARDHIKTIKDMKDANGNYYTYVVFVPEPDGEYIKYNIYVTNDAQAMTIGPLALVDTGIDANPSPPKN